MTEISLLLDFGHHISSALKVSDLTFVVKFSFSCARRVVQGSGMGQTSDYCGMSD